MINEDKKRYGLSNLGLIKGLFTGHAFYAVLHYRIASWLYKHHIKLLPDMVCYRNIRRHGCEISPTSSIDGGLMLHHTVGIVVGCFVKAGKNLEIFQNVTIGSNRKEVDGQIMPIIGDNVSIGSGAVVVGPIKIGNNVLIGANSYVDKDIPDNAVVAGIPAKIIRYKQ
ncbi:hypothetical protein CIK92_08180 [Prevotella sp. P4-67]|uniref:serine O-acetyltransferase n=1 Tax=Prevotella sp. P4-67 TaxID=2024227 RepID=UPI000B972851|nr:DapH/DapD/GlmU-related protein [Prevotella sp. P4-67]OYP71458.1 hypothetical protein CIK92_08180 [Prevotella sp. P4-67]